MAYKVAAIDIHKKMVMVVVATAADAVADPAGEALEFECRRFGTGAEERGHLVKWLSARGVSEAVMESTAQYWKPIWLDLEPHLGKLNLAQAQSNRAPGGRKSDFKDAKRLARRLLAGELMLSFVPEPEQRMWRTLTRSKHQSVRERVRLRNQLEALLEEMRIKLSSVVSDLIGVSGRRILTAMAEGETDAAKLAELGDEGLKCGKQALRDALVGAPEPLHLKVLKLKMERLALLDKHIEELDRLAAGELKKHQDAVGRLAEVPGFGVDSAQQLIAEVGADAAAFPSASEFSSWVGICPGTNESAEHNQSSKSPKGNRFARRILNQAAQGAVNTKGSYFQTLFRRLTPRLGRNGAVWAIAHRIGRLVWKILHEGVRYKEQGQETTPQAKKRRLQRLKKALRDLGYNAVLTPAAQAEAKP